MTSFPYYKVNFKLNNLGKVMHDSFVKASQQLLEAFKPLKDIIMNDYHLLLI